jgi:hypothetical protein
VKLMHVDDCQPSGDLVEDNMVWACPVTFRGKTYHPCFAWSGDRIVKGSRELGGDLDVGYGCERVVWSQALGTLVMP